MKINALRDQMSGILGQVRGRVWACLRKVREKLMAEIDDLERNMPQVSQYNKKGFDPSLPKDEWRCVTNINEQMERKRRVCATAVMSESGNVMDYMKEPRD